MRYSLLEGLLGFWGGRRVDARIVGGLLKSQVAGVAIFDPRLRCVQANAEMARLAQTTPTEIVGRTIEQLLAGRRAEELTAIKRVMATGEPAHARIIEGEGLQLRVDYLPVGAGGSNDGVVVVAVDLTAQHRAEQALTERLSVAQLISELSASFI